MKFANEVGKRFGRLVVLERMANDAFHNATFRVRCDCGQLTTVRGASLRSGETTSCGCWGQRDAHKTHGLCKQFGKRTAEHIAWRSIHRNCTNPRAARYQYFGGKGIQNLFKNFAEFVAHIGPRPSADHFLKRLDTDQHYMPGNVAWREINRKRKRDKIAQLQTLAA